MTLLSICIPVFEAAQALDNSVVQMLGNAQLDPKPDLSPDFEIVICDFRNEVAKRESLIATGVEDARLKLISPGGDATDPGDCWNRMIAHAKGRWITIINADDYADPQICTVLEAMLKRVPDADALSWGRAGFIAPDARMEREIARIPTGSKLLLPEQAEMMRRLFYWEGATATPDCHFSAWHGAVRRELLDQIHDAFSDVHFEQAQPGLDNLCKVVMLSKRMVHWQRPLSVQSLLPVSTETTTKPDNGPDDGPDDGPVDGTVEGFPFSGQTGPTATIAHAIEGFKRRYGIEIEGWEDNFLKACARDCETAATGQMFHARKDAYAKAIVGWRGKRALKLFKPEFRRKPRLPRFQGLKDEMLHIDMAMGGTENAADFYRLINAITFPVHLLDDKLA